MNVSHDISATVVTEKLFGNIEGAIVICFSYWKSITIAVKTIFLWRSRL